MSRLKQHDDVSHPFSIQEEEEKKKTPPKMLSFVFQMNVGLDGWKW